MLSADPELGADADAVFHQIASQARLRSTRQLLTAPFLMQRRLAALIGRVAEAAQAGRPARIVAKFNALTEPGLIEALLAAGRAGVRIDLVVRGACLLPPGLPGASENIRVRSIVGRFLEHTRVLYFRWGDSADEEALYLSSADWMGRNMFGRIELAWPVRDAAARQRVIDECLVPYLHDQLDAWAMAADGSYRRVATEGPSAQQALMQRYRWT
jgi:polyphosphate kinase